MRKLNGRRSRWVQTEAAKHTTAGSIRQRIAYEEEQVRALMSTKSRGSAPTDAIHWATAVHWRAGSNSDPRGTDSRGDRASHSPGRTSDAALWHPDCGAIDDGVGRPGLDEKAGKRGHR